MGGRVGDVVEVGGVAAEVVKFEGGARGLAPEVLEGVEFAGGVEDAEERHAGVAGFLVAGPVEARNFRKEILDEHVVRRDYGSDTVVGVAAAVASGENLRTIGKGGAEEGAALHPRRRGEGGVGERGGREVDQADETRLDAAGGDAGAADEERHVEAFDREPLFAPWHGAAVVREEKHEGVFEDAGFGELGEDDADALVDGLDAALVGIPVAAHERVIGVVGRELEAGERSVVVGFGNGKRTVRLGDLNCAKKGWPDFRFRQSLPSNIWAGSWAKL